MGEEEATPVAPGAVDLPPPREDASIPERPTLLCAALPFGYGPAAKLLALAPRLRERWRLSFVGTGSARELVARSPALFDEVVDASPAGPAAAARLAGAAAVLSLMDRDAGEAACRARRPLVVVDSLLWMRAEVPEALRGAGAYLAQAFPGLEPARYAPRPRVVGPILPETRPPPGPRRGIVVSLGGSAAPDGRADLYAAYARLVGEALARSPLGARGGGAEVVGGAGAAAAGGAVRGVGAEEADARIASAEALVTVPGLTTTLQAFARGTPTWFLPPQNYSQWLVLKRLRQEDAVRGAFHWEDLPGVPALEPGMAPGDHEPVVRAVVGSRSATAEAVERLAASLARVGEDAAALAARQARFLAALGPAGNSAVAAAVDEAAR